MSMHNDSQQKLRSYVERIERLDEDRKAIVADIGDVFAEDKAEGFDPKIMKKVIALRKKPKSERTEEEQLIDTYLHALGGLPLGDWADAREEEHA